MEMAVETWTGEWWKNGGGGTAWDSIAYDETLDLLYIGTGNWSPWNQSIRSPQGGDNFFAKRYINTVIQKTISSLSSTTIFTFSLSNTSNIL